MIIDYSCTIIECILESIKSIEYKTILLLKILKQKLGVKHLVIILPCLIILTKP